MKKFVSIVLCIIFILSFLSACGQPQTSAVASDTPAASVKPSDSPKASESAPEAPGKKEIPQGLKIGYGVSTLNNGFIRHMQPGLKNMPRRSMAQMSRFLTAIRMQM